MANTVFDDQEDPARTGMSEPFRRAGHRPRCDEIVRVAIVIDVRIGRDRALLLSDLDSLTVFAAAHLAVRETDHIAEEAVEVS
jgi:hypothetical protein